MTSFVSKAKSGGKEEIKIFMGHLVPDFSTCSRSFNMHGACQVSHRIPILIKLSRIGFILQADGPRNSIERFLIEFLDQQISEAMTIRSALQVALFTRQNVEGFARSGTPGDAG